MPHQVTAVTVLEANSEWYQTFHWRFQRNPPWFFVDITACSYLCITADASFWVKDSPTLGNLGFWSQNISFNLRPPADMCCKALFVSRNLWEQLWPRAQNCFSSLVSYGIGRGRDLQEDYVESLENPWCPIKQTFQVTWLKCFVDQSLFYIFSLIVSTNPANQNKSQDHKDTLKIPGLSEMAKWERFPLKSTAAGYPILLYAWNSHPYMTSST